MKALKQIMSILSYRLLKTTDQLISSLKMTNDQWTLLIGLPLENGGTNMQRDILHVHVLLNMLSISLLSRVNDMLFQDAKTFS